MDRILMDFREKGGRGVASRGGLHQDREDLLLMCFRPKTWMPMPPYAWSFGAYSGHPPELVPLDLMDDIITEFARHLSGGNGLEGTYSVSLQH